MSIKYEGLFSSYESEFAPMWRQTDKPAATAARCPVCNGNGLVPNGFYNMTGNIWTTADASPEQCRSCGGRGIVWLDK